jgi:uncharacterized protein YlxP (DUF503 family)
MRAAALRFELHIPGSRSLKEKRAALRPVIEGLRRKLSVSVSEVDHHDSWQRAAVGVALVAPNAGRLEALVESIKRYFDDLIEVELVGMEVYHMEESP